MSEVKPDDVPFIDPEKEKGRFKLIEDKNEKLKRKRDKIKEQNELNMVKKKEYESERSRAGLRRNREQKKRTTDQDEIDELNQEKFIMRKYKRGKITKEEMERILDEKIEKDAKSSFKKKSEKNVGKFKV